MGHTPGDGIIVAALCTPATSELDDHELDASAMRAHVTQVERNPTQQPVFMPHQYRMLRQRHVRRRQ